MDLNYILGFAQDYSFPEEAVSLIKKLYAEIEENFALRMCFEKAHTYLFSEEAVQSAESVSIIKEAAEQAEINVYSAYLLFFLAATKKLKELYRNKGIDKDIIYDTLEDITFKLYECKLVTGEYGIYSPDWICGYFRADRFAFGRIQCEIGTLEAEKVNVGNKTLYDGDKVIRIHIPRNDRPFDKETLIKSYKKAYNFFKADFEEKEIPFTCGTWLLFSLNRKILKPTSNIVSFMDDFKIIRESSATHSIWRVFGKEYNGNIDEMPEDTSLMRGYKKWMKEGNEVGSAYGIFLFDGEKIIK